MFNSEYGERTHYLSGKGHRNVFYLAWYTNYMSIKIISNYEKY